MIQEMVRNIIRQHDGPLTRQLRRSLGGFGLGQVPAAEKPDATTTMTCGYCSTGCGLRVHLKDGQAVSLSPDTDYPVNLGMACPKGWEALSVLDAPDRATTPLLRQADGTRKPLLWDAAMRMFVDRFRGIMQKHGRESVAWLGTGQITTEELALLGAVAKFGMGFVHGDGNTRQCMATAVQAYKESFGFDAPPYTYADFEQSDVIVLIGANPCIAHPILWQRILRNPHDPMLIVIDPRRTETAACATHHLALAPKSDLVLMYGLANILLHQNWIDRSFIAAHTNEFDAFVKHVQPFTPSVVEEATGIAQAELMRVASAIGQSKRVSFWWTMGVNQSYEGTRVAQAIINLALMTGNIGKPGTGANSITGQCNAMGSRLFSNTTNLLGGRSFANPQHRQEVAEILGIDVQNIPDRDSQSYHEIVEGIEAGRIKGLWIIGTNSAHSWIGQRKFHDILKKLEFLVVQDIYHSTETAKMADLLLPAAAWGEKEGTFINSERRIGLVKKVKKAPGVALTDFNIFKLVAHFWGCGPMFSRWESPEATFGVMQQLSAGRPCDITGIAGYRMLDASGGVQWPYPKGAASEQTLEPALRVADNERRLFADGKFYHADGRAKFIFEQPRPMPEPVDEEFPLLLLTGRGSAAQWHTQTRTGKSAVLRKLYRSSIYVQIHPADAKELGIEPESLVWVESRRGRIEAAAVLTPSVQPGQVFIPMHYRVTNQLTLPSFDPYSKQPSYKACAVRVTASGYHATTLTSEVHT